MYTVLLNTSFSNHQKTDALQSRKEVFLLGGRLLSLECDGYRQLMLFRYVVLTTSSGMPFQGLGNDQLPRVFAPTFSIR